MRLFHRCSVPICELVLEAIMQFKASNYAINAKESADSSQTTFRTFIKMAGETSGLGKRLQPLQLLSLEVTRSCCSERPRLSCCSERPKLSCCSERPRLSCCEIHLGPDNAPDPSCTTIQYIALQWTVPLKTLFSFRRRPSC